MNFAKHTMKRPVATVMIFVSMLVFGIVAARLLPLEYFPDIDVPFIFVQVPYNGATPLEVEEQITKPLEESLATMSGIMRMQSNSRENSSEIYLELTWGDSVAIKAVEAREKVEAVRHLLPPDARFINVFKFSTGDQAILTLRISSERDLSTSYEMLSRNLVMPLQRIPGVAKVELQGVEPKEIRIELNPSLVAAYSINLNQLRKTLVESNFSASAGLIGSQSMRYRVAPIGEFQSVDEIANMVIREDGLRLADIADIQYGPRERNYGRHLDRNYAIGLEIFRERGANMVDVAAKVLAEIEKISTSPEMNGIELFFLNNQAEGVVSSLSDLTSAGLIGAFLSIFVLYLFLRNLATTLMVTLAVPISLTVTLGCMYFLGVSLNILSMMGLMLAVGMLVDNAVVVSESIFNASQDTSLSPHQAAMKGVEAVSLPVIAGTLTTAVVFLPNIFGEQTQITLFLSHVAYAIVISLAVSLLVSQTIIPMLAVRIKRKTVHEGGWVHRLQSRYGRVLNWSLRHRYGTWGIIILITILSAALPMANVESDMFPREVDRDLFLQYELDDRYPLEKVEEAVFVIENYLYENQEKFEIRAVYTYFDESGRAQSSIMLTENDEAIRPADEIMEDIRKGMPKIAIGEPKFNVERQGGNEGFRVYVSGESTEILQEISYEVIRRLREVQGFTEVYSDMRAGRREIRVHVDRDKSMQYGLDAEQVAQVISVAMRGTPLSEFRDGDGEIPMTLSFEDAENRTLDQLRNLRLVQANGSSLPLASLATFEHARGPRTIRRNDRRTSLGIDADLIGIKMEDAKKEAKAIMDEISFPPGYSWSYGRGFERQDHTMNSMQVNMLLAVAMIYLVMAALFESILFPLSIITSIGFSIFGVFWLFWATGTTFSLMAMIGILILIGIVVNNGIVLIDHINQLRWSGLSRDEAIVQGGKDRLRPILMTVATTVLGLVPLAVGSTSIGGDGPPYFPMARAIIGGLLFSTITTLLFLPSIYVLLDEMQQWRKRVVAKSRIMFGQPSGVVDEQ